MMCQLRGPAFGERLLVAQLMGLQPTAHIGAVAGALVMHHLAGGLYQHAKAPLAYAHGQVGILVIGRAVTRIQAAKRIPELAREHDRRSRAVMAVAQRTVARIAR